MRGWRAAHAHGRRALARETRLTNVLADGILNKLYRFLSLQRASRGTMKTYARETHGIDDVSGIRVSAPNHPQSAAHIHSCHTDTRAYNCTVYHVPMHRCCLGIEYWWHGANTLALLRSAGVHGKFIELSAWILVWEGKWINCCLGCECVYVYYSIFVVGLLACYWGSVSCGVPHFTYICMTLSVLCCVESYWVG